MHNRPKSSKNWTFEDKTNKMAYTAKDPRPTTAFYVPNRNKLYLTETKSLRCEEYNENVHLLTHAPARGVGKNIRGN